MVSFRAMVQDTSCSPEIYLSSGNDLQCGGWGLEDDYSQPNSEQPDYTKLKERTLLWAVNIPGESRWCSENRLDFPAMADETGSVAILPVQLVYPNAHKFPLPGLEHIAVQLKVYDRSAESLRPTDLYTFVGILTAEPVHSDFTSGVLVPTLHILFHRRLPKTIISSPLFSRITDIHTARDTFIAWLSREALGGDRDAAEWVLLSCIASVKSRNPPILPPSITLSNFTRPSTSKVPTLSYILSEVLPLYLFLPLTLNYLNEERFEPESRDEDLNSGVLQVPIGTTILATETEVQEGKLIDKGLRNIQALQDVAKLQTLRYNFPFSQYSFPTDIKFITVTDGGKSLFFEANINVPIHSDASSDLYKIKQIIEWPSPETLAAFRGIIIQARTGKVVVDDALSQHIKTNFVQERQVNKSITSDDLIRQMSISRLVALSRQESQMSMESWILAKELDVRRISRNS
ncbi:hypothetical protein EW145_g1055 [Phellinidium pouzarii]|uniref:Mini-chromosome maintenance complex-binding protein n=1 Tax=Phellinidium pouzarii TaxID=167371 RepID=A0A4S4LGJ8_9AGAM|nr:hypothetical protein EW145_g1055 [Phellinidium pouzarii]